MLVPFHARHGTEPQLSIEPSRESHQETLNVFESRREVAMKEACSTLAKAANHMAQFYDVHNREVPLDVVRDKYGSMDRTP